MSINITNFVNTVIRAGQASVSRPGFGTPLLAAFHNVGGGELVAKFESITDVEDYGFAVDSTVYKLLSLGFQQDPAPAAIKVGKIGTFTHTVKITPTVTTPGFEYAGTINGVAFSHINGASETVASIITALIALIDPIADTTVVNSTTFFTVAHSVPGKVHEIKITKNKYALTIEDTTSLATLVSDLNAIEAADPDFFGVALPFGNATVTAALAGWTEARQTKFGGFPSANSDVIVTGGSDIASVLGGLSRENGAVFHHSTVGNGFAFAALCAILPNTPGSYTAQFLTVKGIEPDDLNATQVGFAIAKNANVYVTAQAEGTSSGVPILHGAKVPSGEFIDTVISLAYIKVNMNVDLFEALRANKKLPFSNAGIDALRNVMWARIEQSVSMGILAAGDPENPVLDPAPYVSPLTVADTLAVDRRARTLKGLAFGGRIEGAIHKVDGPLGFVTF